MMYDNIEAVQFLKWVNKNFSQSHKKGTFWGKISINKKGPARYGELTEDELWEMYNIVRTV